MRSIAIAARARRSTRRAATGVWRWGPTGARSCRMPAPVFGQMEDGQPKACTETSGHGRKEHRTAVVAQAKVSAEHHEFFGLKAFGRIEASRETDEKTTSETRYFALSWTPAREVLLDTVRAHRAIENALHWQLDVSFREDAARNRKDNSPGNIAVLRRRALDLVRRDTSKGSLSMGLKRAGWTTHSYAAFSEGWQRLDPTAMALDKSRRKPILELLRIKEHLKQNRATSGA